MPVLYDKLQRCWRAEDAQGRIVGYYVSETQARGACETTTTTVGQAPVAAAPAEPLGPSATTTVGTAEAAALHLSDGTPVERVTDEHEPSGYAGIFSTEWQGTRISASDDGQVTFSQRFDRRLDPAFSADLDTEGWEALKRLVLSGVVDELLALAMGQARPDVSPLGRAFHAGYVGGREDALATLQQAIAQVAGTPAPPPLPASPPITVEPRLYTDYDDGPTGEPAEFIYHCGDVSLWVDAHDITETPSLCYRPAKATRSNPERLYTDLTDLPPSALREARTLLNSPIVSAILGETPTVQLERRQCVATRPSDSDSLPFIEATCGDAHLVLDNPDRLSSDNPLDCGRASLALLVDGHELSVSAAQFADLRRLLNSPEAAQLVAICDGAPLPPFLAALPLIREAA